MKVGIFGGTFDPIHLGHLRTAQEVGVSLALEKVYLVPAASPPHKTRGTVTPFHDRLHMVKMAVKKSTMLEVLDLEGKRLGPSYSIETLRELHHTLKPDPQLYFIVGIDAFLEINTWKAYEELLNYAHFVVIQRPGFDLNDMESRTAELGLEVRRTEKANVFLAPSGKQLILQMTTLMDISSTHIREMVSGGQSIRFLVPEFVLEYIERKGLYSRNAKPRKGQAMP